MLKKDERDIPTIKEEDIGYLFWELETYESFSPLLKTIMRNE